MRKNLLLFIIMGNLMNYRNNKHHGLSQGLGQKIRNIAEMAGTVKGIYDTSKAVYAIGQAAAPYLLPLLGVL